MNAQSAVPGAPLGAALLDPQRLAAVRLDQLIDSAPEEAFDRHARLARRALHATWAFVTFVDDRRAFYKSRVGPEDPAVSTCVPSTESFCAHVVMGAMPVLVSDTRQDPRFSHFESVRSGRFRAYAGAPVVVDGLCVGTVCVVNDATRAWGKDAREMLVDLAAAVSTEVELRRQADRQRRAQVWIERQQRTLALAMNAGEVNSFDWDIANDHIAWSENLETLLRLPPGSFGGTIEAFAAMVLPEDREMVRQTLERTLAGEDTEYRCDFRMLRGDGTTRWVRAHGIVERDATGRALRLFGVDVDNSNRHDARSQSALANARLENIFAATQIGISVVNSRGAVANANPAFLRMTGYSLEELRCQGWKAITPPEFAQADATTVASLAIQGSSSPNENEYVRKDGTRLRALFDSVRPDPTVDEHVVFAVDVGEHRGADELLQTRENELERDLAQHRSERDALIASRELLAVALDSAKMGMFDWNLAANTFYWDRRLREIWGLDPEAPINLDIFYARLHPDDRAKVQNGIRHKLATGARFQMELRVAWKDGTTRWVVQHAERLVRNGEPSVVGLVQDITVRKQAEEALHARNRQLTMLTHLSASIILDQGSEADVFQSCFHEIGALLGMEMFYHYRLDDEPRTLCLHTAGGVTDEERALFGTIRFGSLLCGRVAESQARLVVEDLQHSGQAGAEMLVAGGAASYAGFPLLVRGQLFGTIAFVSRKRTHFSDGDIQAIQSGCDLLAVMVERRLLLKDLQTSHAELRATAQQLRLAMSASSAIMFEWDIPHDKVRRLGDANVALPETTGFDDRLDDVLRAVHAEDREAFRRNLDSALVGSDGAYTNEFRIVGPDGSVRWFSESGRVEHDEAQRPLRLIGISHDITARKEVEAQLLAQETLTAHITDIAPAVLYVYDLEERRNVWGNREMTTVLGYTREQVDAMAGSLLEQLVHPDDWPRYQTHLERLGRLRDGEVAEFEYRMRRADGIWSWLHSQDMILLRNADGSPRRIVGAALDISARKDVEEALYLTAEALKQEHRRKDEFLAMLAHELRNPLAPLRNSAHFLKRLTGLDPAVEKIRGVVDRQVTHLARLVDDLLDVSRATHGKIRLSKGPVDLTMVVRQAIDLAQPLIDAKSHRLFVTMTTEKTVYVEGDFTRLVQVLSNLLDNAVKYTRAGGEVRLTLTAEGERAALSVGDNGCGIDPELLPHVFDLFTQADRSLDRSQGGLGIGLALVKHLVSLHQGDISIESKVGEGSIVTVSLPRSAVPAQKTLHAASVHPSAPKRILVVDDNSDAAETLATLLRFEGHEVRAVAHSEAALAEAAAFDADVFVLDIGLPGVNGIDLLAQLRAQHAQHPATYIALTGYGRPEDRLRTAQAGFHHHLTKPVDPEALYRAIASR